jgi:hypothetical protein
MPNSKTTIAINLETRLDAAQRYMIEHVEDKNDSAVVEMKAAAVAGKVERFFELLERNGYRAANDYADAVDTYERLAESQSLIQDMVFAPDSTTHTESMASPAGVPLESGWVVPSRLLKF